MGCPFLISTTPFRMTYSAVTLSDPLFNRLSSFIYTNYGIKLPPAKKTMLESRLQRRLRALEYVDFNEYCDFLFSASGQQQELVHMIDVVTTNKTDFFREAAHFDFLQKEVLPKLTLRSTLSQPIKIWSAGCSSGEEVYTLAMVLQEYAEQAGRILDYSLLGTDISSQILDKARQAIYLEEKIQVIPLETRKKYFLKSKDPSKKEVRIVPELRKKAEFKRLNFMDADYDVEYGFDIVFCRNVLIYFDRNTQERVISNLCKKLKPGGYFFLGHSESITEMNLPLQQIKPTVFQRK